MTLEEKQLLLKDLCARLPYGVRIECGHSSTIMYDIRPDTGIINNMYSIDKVKPYLRPMSSMTEEEKVEYYDLQDKFLLSSQYPVSDGYALFDWLNAHHFNYRLPNSLFIEAPKEMYKEQNGKVEH